MRGRWLTGLMLLLAACGHDGGVRVIKLAHGLSIGHPVHRAMVFMAEDLARRSDGGLRLEIHPGEQLGSERECVELLQIGSLGMTKISAAVLASFAPSYRVLTLPYLFRDRAHAEAVLDGELGRRMLLASERYRLRGLTFYDAGSRSFYTRDRRVERPEDLAGLKIRTQESATAMELVRALGASPTPIAWGELYTALQQGVVDGAENNPPSFHLSRHYEVARFFTLDEHTRVPDVLLISTVVWRALSAAERAWIEEAAVASSLVERRLWNDASEEALAAVAAAGVEIVRPEQEPFAARVEELLARYGEDPELSRLIAEIRAVPSRSVEVATGEGEREREGETL